MAKKKLTVTVDESILEDLNRLGFENVSATVNRALLALIEEHLRHEALGRLVDDLIATDGAPSAQDYAVADALLDELEFGAPVELDTAA